MLAGDKLLCSAYVSAHVASLDGESSSGGENPDKYDHLRFYNIKFNHRSIGVYSPLLQHHLYIFVFVYIILLKVVSIVLHLQLSGSSSSPGSFRSFQRAALQAGHLWGSHKRAGNRPKKCGFTARFLENDGT